MKEKFIQFLKDEGVYDSFVKWVVEIPYSQSDADHSSFDAYLDSTRPIFWFVNGFEWSKACDLYDASEVDFADINNDWLDIHAQS